MDKDKVIQHLLEHKRDLMSRREVLFRPLANIDKEIEHVTATIASLQRKGVPVSVTASISIDFPLSRIRGKTQVEALVAIAKHYDGIVRAQEAKKLLIKAGVMRETKNSTNIIHAVIVRSEKFDRVRPGEYRLKGTETESSDRKVFQADQVQ
jgi:hypothetical protein